jgi:hypothetical protein
MKTPHVVVALLAACLALASPARAWTPVFGAGDDARLLALRTHTGTHLLVWGAADHVLASRNGGPPVLVATAPGDGFVLPAAVLQSPGGAILVYATVPGPDYESQTIRTLSTDDGRTWSAPTVAGFPSGARITSAAMRPSGVPLFTALTPDADNDELWYLDVFQGFDGQRHTSRFVRAARGTVGVDASNRAYVAYAADASILMPGRPIGTLVRQLSSDGLPQGRARRLTRQERRVSFIAGPNRSVDAVFSQGGRVRSLDLRTGAATSRAVRPYRHDVDQFALDPRGRLWAAWVDSGTLYATRAERVGAPFRRFVRADLPEKGLVHPLVSSIAAFAGSRGDLDVYVASEGRILHQRFKLRGR